MGGYIIYLLDDDDDNDDDSDSANVWCVGGCPYTHQERAAKSSLPYSHTCKVFNIISSPH